MEATGEDGTHDDRLEVMAVAGDFDVLALEVVEDVLPDLLWRDHVDVRRRMYGGVGTKHADACRPKLPNA
jgi:hypothetical protein